MNRREAFRAAIGGIGIASIGSVAQQGTAVLWPPTAKIHSVTYFADCPQMSLTPRIGEHYYAGVLRSYDSVDVIHSGRRCKQITLYFA